MSASSRNRVRAGLPEGGQFATEARGEPEVHLAATSSPGQLDERAGQLEKLDSFAPEATGLVVRMRLAELRPQLADAGVSEVALDGFWGDPTGPGCHVEWFRTTDGEVHDLDDGDATQDAVPILESLEQDVAPIDQYAEALGQEAGGPVYVHATEDPDGLFDEDRLRSEADRLLTRAHQATFTASTPQPGSRAKWAADQALTSLRYGTDLHDPEDDDQVEAAVSDALANLRHLCADRGVDFDGAVQQSLSYQRGDLEDDAAHQQPHIDQP